MMTLALTRLVNAIRRNHPDLLTRMGTHANAIFLVDPVNLPIMLRMQPSEYGIIECVCRSDTCAWDARIAGPVATLLAMIQGTLDGDALFFSREITIEGNTAAVLALRNAIDAAEIDLTSEFATLFGPFGRLAGGSARAAALIAGRLIGTPLLRPRI
jgi:predicted lipid carrier protein YhbT